jgi:mannose-1-phosphate guanylyltransferase
MKVCIMCGGEGTRLRPLTFERPKPCIPIVNTPSIQHLVSHLSNLGFNDVIITLGYKGNAIENDLGDGSLFGVNITYVHEDTKLGTAGSVKNAQYYLQDAPFLVVGGDHITDIDLLSFYRQHVKDEESIVSVGLVSINDPFEYGIAEIDLNYQIKRFKEKPAPGELFSNLASTGMYVCNPEIFDYIPSNTQFDFARNLFPFLLKEGFILKGNLMRGNWTDVGSPRSLREAERWMLQDIPYTSISGDFTVRGAKIMGPVQVGASITIGKNSRIIGPVSIGAGTIIEDNVLIGPYTSIGNRCIIRSGTKIFSSSIYNQVVVGPSCTISGSIIDNSATLCDYCSVENDTVIGPRAVIKNSALIHAGTRLWPEVVIQDGEIVKEHVLNDAYEVHYSGS